MLISLVYNIAMDNSKCHSTTATINDNNTWSASLNQIDLCLIVNSMRGISSHEDIISMIQDNDILAILLENIMEQVIQRLWGKRYPLIFQLTNNMVCYIDCYHIQANHDKKRSSAVQYDIASSIASVFTRMIKQYSQFGSKCATMFKQPTSSKLNVNSTDTYSEQTIINAFHQLSEHQHKKVVYIVLYTSKTLILVLYQSLLWIASHLFDESLDNHSCSNTESSWWSDTVMDCNESSSMTTTSTIMTMSSTVSSSELDQATYKADFNNDIWDEFSDATSFTDRYMDQ
jgi:hypothetical protein